MANYATLKAAIRDVIKTNGNNEITGALLQQSLVAMIESMGGAGYQYIGVATPATDPGTPDQNVFYLAGAGTYSNFGSLVIPDGNLGILKGSGSTWSLETLPVGSESEINDLKLHSGIAKYSVQPNGFKAGLYWYNNGGIVGSIGSSATMSGVVKAIPVAPGDKVFFSLTVPSGNVGIILADNSNNVVATYDAAATNALNGNLVIPNSVAKLYVNTSQEQINNSYVIVDVLYFDAMLAEINDLKLHSGIANYSVQSDGFKAGLYWYYNNGVIASLNNSDWSAGIINPIPVKEGDILLFSVTPRTGGYSILLVGASNNVIAYYNTPESYNELGGKLEIPANVTKVYFNTTQATVGDSWIIVKGSLLKTIMDQSDAIIVKINNIIRSLFVLPSVQIQSGKAVNYSTGAISDVIGNNAVVIDLTQTKARYIKFIETLSSTYGYGFVVNGVWTGDRVPASAGVNYKEIFVEVPSGATEFRFSWNTGLYANDNQVYCVLEDALLQAYALIGQVAGINSQISILDSAIFRPKTIDISNLISVGGILLNGTYDSNTTFGHVEIPLNGEIIYKTFTFKKTYVNNSTRCCYGFVVNGQWVGFEGNASGGITPTDITVEVPANATTFRCSWNRNQIADNDFVLKCEAFISGGSDVPNKPIFQFLPDYILSRVPTYTSPTKAQADALTPSALYAMYDALRALYPEYITKVDCDAVAQAALSITAPSYMSGLPIYMYKFTPKIGGNSTGADQTSRVKILITSMHPQEKFGMYSMFNLAKMICENWKNDVNSELLRSLVDIYFMPCPWPWNMANNSRANYNGVNGNRQFPTNNWTESGQGTPDWSGTAPLSEYEAKVINYFLLQIKPHVTVDVHTSGNDNMGHMGIFLVNKYDKALVDLCGIIARTTSNRAIQDNANFAQSPDTCLYGVYPEDATAKGEFYEYAYEQGCKFAVLSEESPYSKWDDGVFDIDGPIIEEYTDGILREQIQYLFNTVLRLTRQACVMFYE